MKVKIIDADKKNDNMQVRFSDDIHYAECDVSFDGTFFITKSWNQTMIDIMQKKLDEMTSVEIQTLIINEFKNIIRKCNKTIKQIKDAT